MNEEFYGSTVYYVRQVVNDSELKVSPMIKGKPDHDQRKILNISNPGRFKNISDRNLVLVEVETEEENVVNGSVQGVYYGFKKTP